MKKHLWAIGYTIALTAFTIYITLDTFVLEKSYNINAVESNTAMFDEIEKSTDMADNASDENTENNDNKETSDNGSDFQSSDNTSTHSGKHRPHMPGNHFTSKAAGPETEGDSNVTDNDDSSNDSNNNEGSDISTDSSNSESSGSTKAAEQSKNYDSSYTDENISIELTEYREYNTQIYVADITLTSAEYLKTAFAEDTYGKNVTADTSDIAADHNAVLAINGDYYGVQESGYVIRNGIVYRDKADGSEVLCIYANGTMEVINDSEYTADELVEKGVWQALTFGPGLIESGTISVNTDDEVDMAMSSNPRTAIGMIDKNHFIFVVSDGRTSESEGLSLYELAEFMQKLGVKTAYNLDGGGSSTMYFDGQVINNPTSGRSIKEREVSDIVYIG